ncbi:MAG TPA: rhodanese-like domain-containing protein, partial [Thermoanaerobaculia bacterium]
EDHVDAIELARWIRQRKPGLRVIDLRDPDAFAEYHVPTARNVSLPLLVKTPFDRGETLVLISDGGAHAAQGWVFLRARGHQRVYFLRGGLEEWMSEVMNPAGARGEQAELSRYFGGVPRIDGEAAMTAGELRRRGC